MATLTIRRVDDAVKTALRERAASHGVSMEEEARRILADGVGGARSRKTPTVEEILSYGVGIGEPFDQKTASDELWAYVGRE